MSFKAIIIAAGMGTRLGNMTDDKPKCMVPVGDKPLVEHLRSAFVGAGATELALINGYLAEKFQPAGFNIYTNTDYENNQILESLFFAEKELEGPLVISYGDLVYKPSAIQKLVNAQGDFRVLVDDSWKELYADRDQNPLTDAELCTGTESAVTAIGKGVADYFNGRSEFTGVLYLSAAGTKKFKELYLQMRQEFKDGKRENLNGVPFRKAYMSHQLHELILRGEKVVPVNIGEDWCEIDTIVDYERAVQLFG